MLAHKASEEGTAVVELLAGLTPTVDYMAIPNVVYTNPEVATVGFNEQEALQHGLQIVVGTAYFKANARARCMGSTEGLVKVIAEKEEQASSRHAYCWTFCSEMIGEGVIAMHQHATLDDIAYASHAHPTLTEAILEAVQQARKKTDK